MQKNTAQLDIFDAQVDSLPPLTPMPLVEQQASDPALEYGEHPATLCLFPSAGIRECRECWERHPDLWPRYITRANCVKHTR